MYRMRARLAIVIALGGVLAGCGADELAESAVENAVEQAAEAEGEDVNVDIDLDSEDGELNVETDDGSISVGSGGLPDDFADVPLPGDLEIIGGTAVEQDGEQSYTGTGQYSGDPESALDDLSSFYEGHSSDVTVDSGLNRVTAILDGGLGIQLVAVPESDAGDGSMLVQVHIGPATE